jgi:hypothetical protein
MEKKVKRKRTGTRLYKCWLGMMNRCYKKWCHAYPNYGGRGIRVCNRWHDFDNFAHDMGEMPPKHCIDREKNNLNYTPANCRWITAAESNRNRRSVKKYLFKGELRIIPEISKMCGINASTLRKRMHGGWSIARAAITNPMTPYQKGVLAAKSRWGSQQNA